jgi:ATP-dependent Lon protease
MNQKYDYKDFPMELPILVEKDNIIYPFMIVPIFLTNDAAIEAAKYSLENDKMLFVTSTVDDQETKENEITFYKVGVIGTIMRKVTLPDGKVKILFQGVARAKITQEVSTEPLIGIIEPIEDIPFNQNRVDALLDVIKEQVKKLSSINQSFPPEIVKILDDNEEPYRVSDLIASLLRIPKKSAIEIYNEIDVEKRLIKISQHINKEIENLKLQKSIKNRVSKKMDKHNKEYFLKEQLKEIQKELGDYAQKDEDLEEYRAKFEKLKPYMPNDGIKELSKQLSKFQRVHGDSADATVMQNYIEWILDIPFDRVSKHQLSVQEVESQLDKDHYSLKKPKERISEYFAVQEFLNLRGIKASKDKGTILCFAGPPGVGKTSLANSIAKALKRELIRVALGGLEDVNELRGHRRTYVGAMPGRIIQGLVDAKSMNPVIVLDEIDKVGANHRGDPTAVLLEILDPEQNTKFRDYYVNFNIDLSKAIFIATANDVSRIPAPLRDRMEFITISSYTPSEKAEIAKKYLIPQELKKHGLKRNEFSITKSALESVIENYTRESGVRNLRRVISKLIRKSVKELLKDKTKEKLSITVKNLKEFLEQPIFEIDKANKSGVVGVVNGLAWTSVGGDVLKVEVIKIKGKGALTLTGSLGDVMKESTKIALSVVKTLIDNKKVKIDSEDIPLTQKEKDENITPNSSEIYNRYDLHIHVPQGATPKDGPSAGITMATALASIYSNQKVKPDVAMTGEITLTGEVLPIGGLKEKLIAAYKANIKKALIPTKNYDRDLDDIPSEVKDNLEIVAVKNIEEVLKHSLEEKE